MNKSFVLILGIVLLFSIESAPTGMWKKIAQESRTSIGPCDQPKKSDQEEHKPLKTRWSKLENVVSIGKLALLGAIGGIAGGATNSASSADGNMALTKNALTGALAGVATKFVGSGTNAGEKSTDVMKSGGLGMGIGILSGIGANAPELSETSGNILSGAMGAIAAHSIGADTAITGDGTISYYQFKKAFGNLKEINREQLVQATGIDDVQASQIFKNIGAANKNDPKISVMSLFLYLDIDDSGLLDINEITDTLFFGDLAKAKDFELLVDRESDGTAGNDEMMKVDDPIPKDKFVSYFRYIANNNGLCLVQSLPCEIDESVLNQMTEPSSTNSLVSYADASRVIKTVKKKIKTRSKRISIEDLFNYLACKDCTESSKDHKDTISKLDLYLLTGDKNKAKRAALTLLLFDTKRAERKNKSIFSKLLKQKS